MFPSSSQVQTLQSSLENDLFAFLPELILCFAIVSMLSLRLFSALSRMHMGWIALGMTVASFVVCLCQSFLVPSMKPELIDGKVFTGLLVLDSFANFLRLFLLAFLGFVLWLCLMTGIPDKEDSPDFATLILGATIGMMMMASANHLMSMFIAIEMASVPSYALAGFLKGRRKGSEAALKYVIFGAAASGMMLYGISLVTAKFSTGYFPDLMMGFESLAQNENLDLLLGFGLLFIFVGLGFKLAAVPFHFWCPDVFEGAAAEVGAFLSVASKGAALALTARFLMTIYGQSTDFVHGLIGPTIGIGLAVFAGITATFGNLAAIGQTNLKRLLAYSTIAHAGYMMMALTSLNPQGVQAILFYLGAYFLMNLGAFAVIAFLRNRTGSEDLETYRGAIHQYPILVITLAIFLLSLLGIPPLIGFAAKFQVFAILYDSGVQFADSSPWLSYTLIGLLVLAGINTVVSAGYYLKILRVMILDNPPEPPKSLTAGTNDIPKHGFLALLAGLVIVGGIIWNPLTSASEKGISELGKLPSTRLTNTP